MLALELRVAVGIEDRQRELLAADAEPVGALVELLEGLLLERAGEAAAVGQRARPARVLEGDGRWGGRGGPRWAPAGLAGEAPGPRGGHERERGAPPAGGEQRRAEQRE